MYITAMCLIITRMHWLPGDEIILGRDIPWGLFANAKYHKVS